MPIKVHRQENGQADFQIVTGTRKTDHHNQLHSLLSYHYNNPYHALDEENTKPLHKLKLPNGNIVYSTLDSIQALTEAISQNSYLSTNLVSHLHHNQHLDQSNELNTKKFAIKNTSHHIKKTSNSQTSTNNNSLKNITNFHTKNPIVKN